MEAATQSQPPSSAAAAAAPPKMAIDKFADGGIVCLRFSGTIDESFEGKKLAAQTKAKTLILDLADIKKISSFGIREWVDFINAVGGHVEEIVLIECAPKVVDQLNMVGNFSGKGRVFSFYAPFRCDYCDNDARVLFQVDRDWDVIKSMKPAERACEKCGEPQYFDEDPTTYFSYIVGQQPFELDGDVAAFLSSKLNYAVSDASRKLKIDKIIEGRSTYLKLAGDLDGSFPREKLAEGLEGTVIVDVSGVGKIEPAGAAEWRGFLQMVTPSAESIFLLGVPPVFLEKLTRPEDLGAKGQVITFAIPYTCNTCSTTSLQPVDVEQHYDVLKFATPPETRCGDCKNPMVCAASEALLSHLTTLPKPTITADTKKFIKEVRDRKPEKKKVATTVAEVAAAQPRGGGLMMPLIAAVLVAGLLVGAFFVWQASKSSASANNGLGDLTETSDKTRPDWLIKGMPAFTSYCNDTDGGGMVCVGASAPAPHEEDAEPEAQAAALEAIANALVVHIKDDRLANIAAIWSADRQAKMAAVDQAPNDSNARRPVREARQQVAALLLATGGAAVPAAPTGKYYEGYTNGNSKQYIAYAEYELSPSAVEALVKAYDKPETGLGVTAVTVYPMIAWKYPQLTKGAMITAIDEGPIKGIGVSPRDIVVGIGNDDKALATVASARDLIDLVTTAKDKITKTGGQVYLAIERGQQAPSTYKFEVAAPKAATPPSGDTGGAGGHHGTGGNATTHTGGGGVNVWGRYGGSGQGGRDDPTQ